MLTDEQRADGWIEHDGGPCPVARLVPVEILLRSGVETKFATACSVVWKYGSPIWEIGGDPLPPECEVIAYRMETPDAQ